MRKYLLPKDGKFYKANLHCHTTYSDGKLTPAQIKQAYMERGYSIVAYTDHCLLVPHHKELTDENFVALNGCELDSPEPGIDRMHRKTCHMCFIALDPENVTTPFYHSEKYVFGNMTEYRDKVKRDESVPDYERDHTSECICDMMSKGREMGFFITYNHPTWSLENYSDYINFHGMHAMEMYNYLSRVGGHEDINPRVYDDILRGGERIYCIGADDNHNGRAFDHRRCDSFGAWTMIRAEKLEYTAVTDALLKGHFYASTGPEIKELYLENGEIHIQTSPCESIIMHTNCRRSVSVHREKGRSLTKASFPVYEDCTYVRFTVFDKKNERADTNAYWTNELLSDK